MFRQHIACHHQGALAVLAKITIKYAHARGVRGVAAFRGSVCAVYTVRVFPCSEVYDFDIYISLIDGKVSFVQDFHFDLRS